MLARTLAILAVLTALALPGLHAHGARVVAFEDGGDAVASDAAPACAVCFHLATTAAAKVDAPARTAEATPRSGRAAPPATAAPAAAPSEAPPSTRGPPVR
jgi:hypothetical protein